MTMNAKFNAEELGDLLQSNATPSTSTNYKELDELEFKELDELELERCVGGKVTIKVKKNKVEK
jgi:hypothetical protein